MSKQEELIKLDRSIKEAEFRLRNFNLNIETIQKEIDFLITIESQIEENIAYLKNIKVVTLAVEYKKAKENLKKTKTKLMQLKSDKIINEKAQKELAFFIQKNKETYDKLSKQSENNVLQGKFGRKRG